MASLLVVDDDTDVLDAFCATLSAASMAIDLTDGERPVLINMLTVEIEAKGDWSSPCAFTTP